MDEIPYDFVHKRLSVIAANARGERTLITKRALDKIPSICTSHQYGEGYDQYKPPPTGVEEYPLTGGCALEPLVLE